MINDAVSQNSFMLSMVVDSNDRKFPAKKRVKSIPLTIKVISEPAIDSQPPVNTISDFRRIDPVHKDAVNGLLCNDTSRGSGQDLMNNGDGSRLMNYADLIRKFHDFDISSLTPFVLKDISGEVEDARKDTEPFKKTDLNLFFNEFRDRKYMERLSRSVQERGCALQEDWQEFYPEQSGLRQRVEVERLQIGKKNEDRCCYGLFMLPLPGKNIPVFFSGVFDGHAGNLASSLLAINIQSCLENSLKQVCRKTAGAAEIYYALKITFAKLQRIVEEEAVKKGGYAGTTANVLVRIEDQYWFACVGDSRAWLYNPYNDREPQIIPATEPAKCDNQKYQDKIKALGGTVENNRVGGVLAPATSIGRYPVIVCHDPVITQFDAKRWPVVIQATDGLWDVVSTSQLAELAARSTLSNSSYPGSLPVMAGSAAFYLRDKSGIPDDDITVQSLCFREDDKDELLPKLPEFDEVFSVSPENQHGQITVSRKRHGSPLLEETHKKVFCHDRSDDSNKGCEPEQQSIYRGVERSLMADDETAGKCVSSGFSQDKIRQSRYQPVTEPITPVLDDDVACSSGDHQTVAHAKIPELPVSAFSDIQSADGKGDTSHPMDKNPRSVLISGMGIKPLWTLYPSREIEMSAIDGSDPASTDIPELGCIEPQSKQTRKRLKGMTDEQKRKRRMQSNRTSAQNSRDNRKIEISKLEEEAGDQGEVIRQSLPNFNFWELDAVVEKVAYYRGKGFGIDVPDGELANLINELHGVRGKEIKEKCKEQYDFTKDEFRKLAQLRKKIKNSFLSSKSRKKGKEYHSRLKAFTTKNKEYSTAQAAPTVSAPMPKSLCEAVDGQSESSVFPASTEQLPGTLRDHEYASTLH